MNNKVQAALERLDTILPLLSGLKSLNAGDAALYESLIQSYMQRGRALSLQELRELCDNSQQALNNIVESKLIVLDADGSPAGAYPFTSQEREHKIRVDEVDVHCMCALDALAVSSMFNIPTVIDSKCCMTNEKIHIQQNRKEIFGSSLDAWFGINWGAAAPDKACSESLCMEMIFLVNKSVARSWLAESPDTREIFDLPSAVDFAAGFFVPLAENLRGRV